MNLVMIESAVSTYLKEVKDNPGRGTRNLIDLGLHFAKGRFQKHIFTVAQTMLSNPHSSYYRLIRNVVKYVDTGILKTFGINLGYHAWTTGAATIREAEQRSGHNIPWTVVFESSEHHSLDDDEIIRIIIEGKALGINSYMFFGDRNDFPLDTILTEFADCAFFLFVEPGSVDTEFVGLLQKARNTVCSIHMPLRETPFPQSSINLLAKGHCMFGFHDWYGNGDLSAIESGSWFSRCEKAHGVFTFLIQKPDCDDLVALKIHQILRDAKSGQQYGVFTIDFYEDLARIDQTLSVEPCYFGIKGDGSVVTGSRATSETTSIIGCPLSNALSRLMPRISYI